MSKSISISLAGSNYVFLLLDPTPVRSTPTHGPQIAIIRVWQNRSVVVVSIIPIRGLYFVPYPSSSCWNRSLVVCLEGKGLQGQVWGPRSVAKAASSRWPEVLLQAQLEGLLVVPWEAVQDFRVMHLALLKCPHPLMKSPIFRVLFLPNYALGLIKGNPA